MAPTSGNYSILSDTDTLDADSVFIAPDNISGAPNFLGSTSVPLSLQHIKGYQVSAIVVCVIVVLAVILCHVTWRLRFKIVLRQVGLICHIALCFICDIALWLGSNIVLCLICHIALCLGSDSVILLHIWGALIHVSHYLLSSTLTRLMLRVC